MATPLIPFTIVWLIGLWLASRIAVPSVALGVAAIVAVVGAVLTWRTQKLRWIFVLAFAVVLGALRYNLAQPHFDQTSLATYNDQQKSVIVEGIVAGEPDARDACQASVQGTRALPCRSCTTVRRPIPNEK
jgi:hypothetical protein